MGDNPMPASFPAAAPIAAALGEPAVAAGGIALYRVPPAMLAPYRKVDWLRMETFADAQRFAALLIAARSYLASGADPARLAPASAAEFGYLPAAWLPPRKRTNDYRLYIRAESDGLVTVGLLRSPAALRSLIDRYGPYARRVTFTGRRSADESKFPQAGDILLLPAADDVRSDRAGPGDGIGALGAGEARSRPQISIDRNPRRALTRMLWLR